uniref:NADH dehydrogenase subunit 6 n=1 Tax=Vespa basalis TaxID=7444 RepID=A0A6B9QN29_VESBA|nr:NADH dehydrogenase subunit 6 [Vespa basalis]
MMKSIINLFCILMLWIMLFMIINPNLSVIQTMILLILFTVTVCLSINLYYTFSLYSFLIFLMIIGGLLILFMMFISLISNQYNHFKFKYMAISMLISITLSTLLYKYSLMNTNLINLSMKSMSINSFFMNLNQLMSFPFNIYIISLMCFLLFYLILITKICIINSKPLRMIKK